MVEVGVTQTLVRVTATQTARLTIKDWLEAIHLLMRRILNGHSSSLLFDESES